MMKTRAATLGFGSNIPRMETARLSPVSRVTLLASESLLLSRP